MIIELTVQNSAGSEVRDSSCSIYFSHPAAEGGQDCLSSQFFVVSATARHGQDSQRRGASAARSP
jgi:hypothetical protein